ncbi:hypothetical protein IAQ61_002011 [Plenodomus lingam]|uniref:uncharacterized protein n=1 Tax=Leptosphaeria maculans TaxID=5022 RepID=UPI003332926D|nr:hypothetical protein IAQ61_002011 [Plenodomus lingam]
MAPPFLMAPPLPILPIPPSSLPLFTAINTYVHTYMSQYDNSHDYAHILRVLSNTHLIHTSELHIHPTTPYDPTALYLAALLHDVGDHKYATPDQDSEAYIATLLQQHGAPAALAHKVQDIVTCVSYSHEVRNPEKVRVMLQKHPELAIVQDADRLDAIGAVGIGRCFSFGAAKLPEQGMERVVAHFADKLYRLEGMMKTECGREMAGRRTEVLRGFEREWRSEVELSFELS